MLLISTIAGPLMENDHGVEGHACPLSFSVARLADSAPTVEMTPINADTRNKVVSIVTPKAFRVSLVRVCATTDQRSILLIGDAIFTLLSSVFIGLIREGGH